MDKEYEGNPNLQIPNPYDELNKSIEQMQKLHPELLEFARLCYEVFYLNEDGKKLLQLLENRYLKQSLVNPLIVKDPHLLSLYWNGFTDCIKSFILNANEHKQRVVAA